MISSSVNTKTYFSSEKDEENEKNAKIFTDSYDSVAELNMSVLVSFCPWPLCIGVRDGINLNYF